MKESVQLINTSPSFLKSGVKERDCIARRFHYFYSHHESSNEHSDLTLSIFYV